MENKIYPLNVDADSPLSLKPKKTPKKKPSFKEWIKERKAMVIAVSAICILAVGTVAVYTMDLTSFLKGNIGDNFNNKADCEAEGYFWDSGIKVCKAEVPFADKEGTKVNQEPGVSFIIGEIGNQQYNKDNFYIPGPKPDGGSTPLEVQIFNTGSIGICVEAKIMDNWGQIVYTDEKCSVGNFPVMEFFGLDDNEKLLLPGDYELKVKVRPKKPYGDKYYEVETISLEIRYGPEKGPVFKQDSVKVFNYTTQEEINPNGQINQLESLVAIFKIDDVGYETATTTLQFLKEDKEELKISKQNKTLSGNKALYGEEFDLNPGTYKLVFKIANGSEANPEKYSDQIEWGNIEVKEVFPDIQLGLGLNEGGDYKNIDYKNMDYTFGFKDLDEEDLDEEEPDLVIFKSDNDEKLGIVDFDIIFESDNDEKLEVVDFDTKNQQFTLPSDIKLEFKKVSPATPQQTDTEISFTLEVTSDEKGPFNYYINFGEDETDVTLQNKAEKTATFKHKYLTAGSYDVTAIVVEVDGTKKGGATTSYLVTAPPPPDDNGANDLPPPPTKENCTNNKDDDGDKLIDYEDKDDCKIPKSEEIDVYNDGVSSKKFNPDINAIKIYYWLDKEADVTVEIVDDKGKNTVTLEEDKEKKEGFNYIWWEGTKDNKATGQKVKDGTYTYKITASHTKYPTIQDSEEGPIEVDSKYDTGEKDFEDPGGGSGSGTDPETKKDVPPPTTPTKTSNEATKAMQTAKGGDTAGTGPGVLIYLLFPIIPFAFRKVKH